MSWWTSLNLFWNMNFPVVPCFCFQLIGIQIKTFNLLSIIHSGSGCYLRMLFCWIHAQCVSFPVQLLVFGTSRPFDICWIFPLFTFLYHFLAKVNLLLCVHWKTATNIMRLFQKWLLKFIVKFQVALLSIPVNRGNYMPRGI